MLIFNNWPTLAGHFANPVVALGTFDGLHIGHQAVIGEAVGRARQLGGQTVVFTFANHPLSAVNPTQCPLRVVGDGDKMILLRRLAVDIVLNIPFTAEMYQMAAPAFCRELRQLLAPAAVVVGENFTFGRGARGTPYTLLAEGLPVVVRPSVTVDGRVVSSTLIRRMIATGQVEQAARMLGRPPVLRGRVQAGNRIGRTLGFPTANLGWPFGCVVPEDGVYAALAAFDQRLRPAVVNIGCNPTFAGSGRRIEVHLPGWQGNLYGRELAVWFCRRLRPEIRFADRRQLAAQISEDCRQAIQLLSDDCCRQFWL
ncbi:MAG: riboflavin biosynthesis protein RibF [Negativicutes bacterium]|nr:riboflavin biosynthesis protein RibF [Negativicutes bacterium]